MSRSSFELTFRQLTELLQSGETVKDEELIQLSLEEFEHELQPLSQDEGPEKCRAWGLVVRSGERELWRYEGMTDSPPKLPPASYRAGDLRRRHQEMVEFVATGGTEPQPKELVQVTLSKNNILMRLRGRSWTVTAVS